MTTDASNDVTIAALIGRPHRKGYWFDVKEYSIGVASLSYRPTWLSILDCLCGYI